jgi:hypothetical protein
MAVEADELGGAEPPQAVSAAASTVTVAAAAVTVSRPLVRMAFLGR